MDYDYTISDNDAFYDDNPLYSQPDSVGKKFLKVLAFAISLLLVMVMVSIPTVLLLYYFGVGRH